jgi:hypothetical protein
VNGAAGGSAVEAGQASPTLARVVVGSRLRWHRQDRGLSLEEAGDAIGVPDWLIRHMERGEIQLRMRDVAGLCALYALTDLGECATLLGLARQANAPEWWHAYRDVVPGWFRRYLSLEQAACTIRSYAPQILPALLQTPDYARAVVTLAHAGAAEQDIERRVELRLRRQGILQRPGPAHLWTVIDEAALRRPIGGRAVMRAQVRHLIDMCDLAHVSIWVLPFRLGGHPATGGGPVSVLRLPDRQLPDVVYLEQFASGLYFDEPGECDYYRHMMNRLAIQAAPAGPPQAILHQILRDMISFS